jgi:hypothetical protein
VLRCVVRHVENFVGESLACELQAGEDPAHGRACVVQRVAVAGERDEAGELAEDRRDVDVVAGLAPDGRGRSENVR